MKKSAIYTLAMLSVLRDEQTPSTVKLDVIETLLADRSVARWSEEQEAKKKEAAESEKFL